MRWRSKWRWLLVPITGGCLAWATVGVLAVFSDSATVGANTFTTGTWVCGGPGSQTVVAAADAWIDEANANQNSGSTGTLQVRSSNTSGNQRALVRFALPAVPAGCSVTAATLRLYASSQIIGRTIDVHRAASPWDEGTVTWNTGPGATGTAAGSLTLGVAGWQEWTVTAQVIAQYASNNGFVVRDGTEGAVLPLQQIYRSRESGTNRPELVVTFG